MKKPAHAVTIRNYREFRDDIEKFAEAKYNCLLVIGSSGIGKTSIVGEVLGPRCAVTSGSPTAWGFYQWAHDNLDKFLVLDDVSPKFFKANETNAMLKNLTETRPIKTLRWATASAGDDKHYPRKFETSSRVIILCNKWESISEHVRAIEGRAATFLFEPTPTEVHQEVARWFTDQEVFDYIWEYRRFVTQPDMRLYAKALESKLAGSPWRKRALEMMVGDERLMQTADLLLDLKYTSNNERQEAFVQAGYGSRTTFYELLREFRYYKTETVNDAPVMLKKRVDTTKNPSEANLKSADCWTGNNKASVVTQVH